MESREAEPVAPENLNIKRRIAAHHEAGHLVVAAAEGLKLGPGGISVDPVGKGFASYDTDAQGADDLRKKIITATFAGFCAEKRCCAVSGYPIPEEDWSSRADWYEAWGILDLIAVENLYSGNAAFTCNELMKCSERLVEDNWPAVEVLASVLLQRECEPIRPLKVGPPWSDDSVAQYVKGQEAIEILKPLGIVAICLSDS